VVLQFVITYSLVWVYLLAKEHDVITQYTIIGILKPWM
jgi:hypothetical protein